MDKAIVFSNDRKKFKDYLPVWLKNVHSLFYYFLFLVALGVVFFATSLFINYFTTPFTGDYCMQQFAFYTNGYDDWWHFFTTGEFVLYDRNTFLGVDNIGSNSFYYLFDPFFWPILLVPRQLVPQGMAVLTIFKIAASGMTFFLYMRYLGASRIASKITGLAYAFSGWMTWYLWFNHFTEVAIVLPLILLGVEMTLKQRKPCLLMFSISLMGFVNFFFCVCFVMCAFLYAMFRFFQTIKSRDLRENLFALLFGFCGFLVGLILPMMVVLPSAMHSLTAPRAASSTYLKDLGEAFKAKNMKTIFKLLTSWTAKSNSEQNKARLLYPFIDFVYPVASCRGTPLTVLGNETYDNVAGSTYCFLPMMCLIVPAFMDSLNKKHFSVLVPLAFFVVALFTPFFYYMFHGFTEAYSRWTLFVTTSIMAYTGLYLDKIKEKPFYVLIIGVASMILFAAIGAICAYYIAKTYTNYVERVPVWLAVSLEILYLNILAGVLILVKLFKKPKFYGVFTGFIVTEIALMGAFVVQGHGVEDYYWTNKGVVKNDVLHKLVEKTYRKDKSYYRSYSSLGSDTSSNDQMRNGFNGANFFHSIYNFNTADICNWSSITNGTSPHSWSGNYIQKRPYLDTLLGIKYYYVEDDYFLYQSRRDASSENFRYNVPLNYLDVTDEYKNSEFRVYKNTDYIDFALTYDTIYPVEGDPLKNYDSYSLYSNPGGKNTLVNEELYMKAAIINTTRNPNLISSIKENYPDISVEDLPLYRTTDFYYSLRTSGTDAYASDCLITYYDAFSAGKSSLGLPAKDYITLCNRDNTTFTHYQQLPEEDDKGTYRRWIVVLDSRSGYFPNYDPKGNIYYLDANFEWAHEIDVYFVDTNDQIVTYDNHNDGYYSSTRNGKQYRAFYISPVYGTDENGELTIVKDAPKIKKIILATRSHRVKKLYPVLIDTYTKHEQKIESLKQYVVTDVKSSANKYSFKTNFDKNRVVVTRLAYEEGFTLKMKDANGKKQNVEVFNGQGGFVSFISGKGACSYTLEFYTPYLALGSYLSAVGNFAFAHTLLACIYFEMKRKDEEELHLFRR